MSIKPFTNEELQISQKERKALVKMRKLLLATPARPKLLERDDYSDDVTGCRLPNFNGPTFFNMSKAAENTECGTVCCIGGGMALLMGMGRRKASEYVAHHEPLNKLFYPEDAGGHQYDDYTSIKPKQAAQAIENFLFCGTPRWQTILGKAWKG